MFQIEVRKADAILRKSEVITSGSVQAYGACFEFVHPIWQSLMKQAVFRCGDIQIGVMSDRKWANASSLGGTAVPRRRSWRLVCMVSRESRHRVADHLGTRRNDPAGSR